MTEFLGTLSAEQRAELESFDAYKDAIEHPLEEGYPQSVLKMHGYDAEDMDAKVILAVYERAIGYSRSKNQHYPSNRKSAELWLSTRIEEWPKHRRRTSAQIAKLLLDTVRELTTR